MESVWIESVKAYLELEDKDFKVLRAMEVGAASYQYIPAEFMSQRSRLTIDETRHVLDHLHVLGLVHRRTYAEVGYILNSSGYDCLAITNLVSGGALTAFGHPIGVGKESDVYDALADGRHLAVKFHRLGRTSFRQTKKLRPYASEHSTLNWQVESSHAAAREFAALRLLFPAGVAVPEPIARNRHVLVMGLVEGDPLYVCSHLPEPITFLKALLDEVRMAWNAGAVHSDLSEYNVIVTPALTPLIIDWPQWTPTTHTNGILKLKTDVLNILHFFKRKFRLDMKPRDVLQHSGLPLEEADVRFKA